MIVKSFVLRPASVGQIVEQCTPGVIAVVRPEKALEQLLREAAREMIVRRRSAAAQIAAVDAYFDSVCTDPEFAARKSEFIGYVQDYLHRGMIVNVQLPEVEDYLLAQCAVLCAQAVAAAGESGGAAASPKGDKPGIPAAS
ncbi:MAG: hypothetical protein J5693_04705, partial [Bacteroidales bacterium]|nr:hypothetical protein [Bacteroidales bacterium]